MKLVLKIFLCVFVFGAAFFPGVLIAILLWSENQRFEWTMLIPVGLSVMGFCSLIFHVKTVKLYRLWEADKLFPKPNSLLWGLNLGYAGALVLLGLWFVYLIFIRYGSSAGGGTEEFLIILLVIGVPIFLGALLFMEAFLITRKLEQNKAKEVLLEIDNIKGEGN